MNFAPGVVLSTSGINDIGRELAWNSLLEGDAAQVMAQTTLLAQRQELVAASNLDRCGRVGVAAVSQLAGKVTACKCMES